MPELKKTDNIIKEIISIEWDMFQNVHNMGGRASCQDNWKTFYIMRWSQFSCWTDEMRELYLQHLKNAKGKGRNLLAEKYGRMMEKTESNYYKTEIEPFIPRISAHKRIVITKIISVLVIWEREFAEIYPSLARRSRPITSDEEFSGAVAMETYQKCELCTYSEALLDVYLSYIEELKAEGKSISIMEREAMIKFYGYASIEDAEAAIV